MRTGLTTLCPTCALRIESTRVACPSCGGASLVDLRVAGASQRARSAMQVPAPSSPRREIPLLPAAIVLAVIIVVGFEYMPERVFGRWLIYWFAAAYVSPLALLGLVRLSRIRAARPPAPPPIRGMAPLRFDPPRTPSRGAVRGRVRAHETLASPLAGRACVAFRVAGDIGLDVLDDAVCASFDVQTADGEFVAVPEGAAALALELPSPGAVPWTPRLAALLAERGVPPGHAVLSEAVLVDGDEVIVEGALRARDVPDGLRGSREAHAVVETDDAPRIVRRA